MATKKQYDDESIKSLKGAQRVRERPGVIFGSDGLEGCEHSFFEILSNSIDEAREGFGKEIVVTKFKDGSIEVKDFGRGIPVGFNKSEEIYNWELIFCELYAGGKYTKSDDDNYKYSLGLNGLGLCATQYSSEYMEVTIKRDGYEYRLNFEHGENVGGLKSKKIKEKETGTTIRWKPDLLVFTEIDIPIEYFKDVLKRQAVVNSGILFKFYYEGELEEFCYKDGIKDYVKEIVKEDALSKILYLKSEKKGKDREDKETYRVLLSCAFCFSNRVKLIEYYHNSSFLEHGGSPERALKQAFVSKIHAYLKENGKYNKNESKISFVDIEESLVFVSSSFSTQTSYENQTKKAITNKFIYEAMLDFLKHNLEIYFIENPQEIEKVAKQILVNKRSREKAEKTRLNLKKTLAGGVDLVNRIQKFVDCRTKNKNERELFIVEGDSALGACKQSRDANFQAIIPVRGKILNCLKSDYDKIFKNEIIRDLIKVLGCGVEVKNKFSKDFSNFNLEGLRWNKIIICTDADVDGFQIRTLILTMLYRLTPGLIEKGYVYLALSPLFEISTKNKKYFAYNEEEKVKILDMLEKEKKSYEISRSKGLGENEPDMMWHTTMCPKTRRLIKVAPEQEKKTKEMFDLMLGDNLQGRKEFISNFGVKYISQADVS